MKEMVCDPAAWSYAGATGPEYWERFAPLCKNGRQQSPIDLAPVTPADLDPIRFAYDTRAIAIVNNGHAIEIRFAPGATFEADGRAFKLDNLHFHVPAEHHTGGKTYALEAHFVNVDDAGHIAVVALLYNVGIADPALAKIVSRLPAKPGERGAIGETSCAADFLPPDCDYYFYRGSLTTPPCTEGVDWFVLKTQFSVSPEQAEKLMHAGGGPNARPLQPLNDRKVLAQREPV